MSSELSPLMSFIERAAREPEFDLNKFSELLRLQQEAEDKQAKRAFNAAMASVEAEIGPVLRDRVNPGVNRKYATLEAIDAAARPIYSAHGLSIRFGCDVPPKDGWMRITCTVSHRDGYSETNYLDSPVDIAQRARTPVQAVGSTISYCRRYLLQMCLNIVLADDPVDDDGEAQRIQRPSPPNGDRKPADTAPNYAEIVAMFETAAARIKDSDEARKLMEWKPGVIALTALPHGEERQRYMLMRSKVQADWLTNKDDGSSASEDIEGL